MKRSLQHWQEFVDWQIVVDGCGSASEAPHVNLCLLEVCEQWAITLRQALTEGEASGDAGELNMSAIKCKARP